LDDEPTQETLDGSVPDGTYTIQMNTVREGTHTVDLTLTSSDYPPAPQALIS
jgi:hypothetical protein